MPIIASGMIPINVRRDRIDILVKKISECGCLDMNRLKLDIPRDELKSTLDALVGQGKISCNDERTICCADRQKLESFVSKLARLRG